MKLDKNCIRLVLIYIQDHCIYENNKFDIRSEAVWNKTKSVLQKVGDFCSNIMAQVAGKTMAAYTKSMMNLN